MSRLFDVILICMRGEDRQNKVVSRASNIELLRIVSMLMVLNVHTFFAPDDLCLSINNGLLLRNFIDFFRESTSISCVNLFVIISGYFSIKWKIKGISSLIFQVYFWIFLIYAICLCIGYTTFGWMDLARYGIGIMSCYWFIPAYIGLYVLAPLLNGFVEQSSKKRLLKYIIVFYIFLIIDSLPFASNYTLNGYSIFSFCGLYLIGSYIRISRFSSLKIFQSKTKIFILFLLITLIITIETMVFSMVLNKGKTDLVSCLLSPLSYNNPLVIIQTILIFIFFSKLKIHSNLINWMSVSALSIYLLHMHPAIKQDFYGYVQYLYSVPILSQYISLLLLFISVLLIAIPLDKIRLLIFNNLYEFFESNWNKKKSVK